MQNRAGLRRMLRWFFAPVIVALLVTQAAPHAQADDPAADLNKARDKQKYIQEQKQAATNELSRIYWEAEEANSQLQKVEEELAAANSQLIVITRESNKAQETLKQIEAELEATRKRYEERKELLANRIRAINEEGRVDYLSVLFGSTTFTDFISRFDMLRLVVKQDAELFDHVKADKAALETKQQEAAARRNQLALLRQQAEERTRTVEAKRSERQVVSRSLDSRKSQLKAQLEEFDRQEELVAQQIAEIQRRMGRKAGRFAPIPPVRRPYTITDVFGPRLHPILNVWRPHNGTDFAANYGTPVLAIEDGVVIVAEWNDAYGNLTVIDHGGGVASWYGHASKILVKVGDTVTQGQQIANAGSTGWSTGPHVHLEIRFNGTPKNPLDYVQ